MKFITQPTAEPGAYVIFDPKTDISYFGGTANLKRRLAHHSTSLKNDHHHNEGLQNLYKETNGELHVIVTPTETREDAFGLEQALLTEFFDTGLLVNVSKRAFQAFKDIPTSEDTRRKLSERMKGNKLGLGRIVTEETRKKLSESLKITFSKNPKSQETIDKWRESRKSYVPSQETLEKYKLIGESRRGISRPPEVGQKVSKARKGIVFSDEHKEKLSKAKVNPVTINGVVYGNRAIASRSLNLSLEKVDTLVAGKKPTHTPVVVEGKHYPSMKAAQEDLNITKSMLTHRLNSENEKYKDYRKV
jgi:co-chaperonin GroES (HSP10)/predicted GIY-YIG superfamily endonuclease